MHMCFHQNLLGRGLRSLAVIGATAVFLPAMVARAPMMSPTRTFNYDVTGDGVNEAINVYAAPNSTLGTNATVKAVQAGTALYTLPAFNRVRVSEQCL